MMKDRSPAFQFYPRQFAADDHVTAMDLDSVGAHVILMCAAAASPEGYRISTDERAIRNRLRNPSEQDWQRIKGQLLAGAWKLSADGLWFEQHGLQRTFEKQKAFSEAQRARANVRYSRTSTEPVPPEHPAATEPAPESCSASASASPIPITTNPERDTDPEVLKGLGEVWNYYLKVTERKPSTYAFTAVRKRKGIARMKECLSKVGNDNGEAMEMMKRAIDGIASSDWHMGRDPKTNGKRYCEWEGHLFGSYEAMERWWNTAPSNTGKVQPGSLTPAQIREQREAIQ
ncbi:MAG: hypothetical protein JWO13_2722 [Acidobacteriales bacterium]|nr:hypothetical protein [Terriglobales bacterium]